MRVITCLALDHNPWLVLLAAVMCVVGASVFARLFQRTFTDTGAARLHWGFLSSVTAGASVWATHFIAMLGYRPDVPVTFNATLTVVSALIAVLGVGIALALSTIRNRAVAAVTGGGTFGLAIAAMHYTGMFAYRVDGLVEWLPGYVAASIVFAIVLSAFAIDRLKRARQRVDVAAVALFVTAIVALHFTGMAAFVVHPMPGIMQGADSQAFVAMATSIALVGMLIVGVGISTHLLERRTHNRSQEQLQHQALHDALTGLANRRNFREALRRECSRNRRFGRPFALLMVDLDRFKPINDSLGHPFGDEILRMVGARLKSAVRENDLVARIGGDEFAIIAVNIETAEAAAELADRIVHILAQSFLNDGKIADLGGSVGIALAPEHGGEEEALVQHADIALYTAKRSGKNRACMFEVGLVEALQRRRFIESELRSAAAHDGFDVMYQPVIDPKSGRFTGAEALVRWNCRERGSVPPAEFIPIAEELGLVGRIGAFVLRRACFDATSWPPEMDVAVNLSPVQLLDPGLVDMVKQALADSGLPSTRLELEITETALLSDDEAVLRVLEELTAMGVRISLDDFGTGYSSLSYLHRFPISRIKIDRSFVQRLPSDPGSASIVRAIAQLGENLNMQITAEGIETDEQLAFIAQHGCGQVQGFLISHPVPSAAVFGLFTTNAATAAA